MDDDVEVTQVWNPETEDWDVVAEDFGPVQGNKVENHFNTTDPWLGSGFSNFVMQYFRISDTGGVQIMVD